MQEVWGVELANRSEEVVVGPLVPFGRRRGVRNLFAVERRSLAEPANDVEDVPRDPERLVVLEVAPVSRVVSVGRARCAVGDEDVVDGEADVELSVVGIIAQVRAGIIAQVRVLGIHTLRTG